jgi:hypothetical protein
MPIPGLVAEDEEEDVAKRVRMKYNFVVEILSQYWSRLFQE